MNRKRNVTLILGIVFFLLAFYSMLAWINNLSVARQWHHDVVQKSEKVAKKNGDGKTDKSSKKEKEEKVYKGPMSYLDWTCVDMTTVSTFVPFLGFLLIGIGFFRILMLEKNGNTVSKNFPFFEDYDRMMVILGLSGTLWGIIMIGYYPTEEVNMPKLILCLHTSLYSTLIVVLWIFLIARPMGSAMRWWYGNITGKEISENADISALFRELGAAVSGATVKFKEAGGQAAEFQKQTEATKKELEKVTAFLVEFQKQTGLDVFGAIQGLLDNLTASCQNINDTLKTLRAESQANQKTIGKQEKTIEKQQEFLDRLNEKLSREMRLRQEAEEKRAKAEKEKDEATSYLERLKTFLKSLK